MVVLMLKHRDLSRNYFSLKVSYCLKIHFDVELIIDEVYSRYISMRPYTMQKYKTITNILLIYHFLRIKSLLQ